MASEKHQCSSSGYAVPGFLLLTTLVTMVASQAMADEVRYNLQMTVHDFGRLIAGTRACHQAVDAESIKQTVLDIVRADPDLDDMRVASAMDTAVAAERLRIPGCSQAGVGIARTNFDRDLKDFKFAVQDH